MVNDDNIKNNKSSISQATSYEEIGEFWDEHGLDEYWDQTYPVEFKINSKFRTEKKVYYGLDQELSQKLSKLAENMRISDEELLNQLVIEKLQEKMAQ